MRFMNKAKILSILPQIVAMLFLAGFVVFAWTEPSQPPPSGNVDPPVNTGSISQYKAGALGVGGILQAFSDLIVNENVGIGTTNPQGILDVGGGKLVVTTEGATNFTAGPNNPTLVVNEGGARLDKSGKRGVERQQLRAYWHRR